MRVFVFVLACLMKLQVVKMRKHMVVERGQAISRKGNRIALQMAVTGNIVDCQKTLKNHHKSALALAKLGLICTRAETRGVQLERYSTVGDKCRVHHIKTKSQLLTYANIFHVTSHKDQRPQASSANIDRSKNNSPSLFHHKQNETRQQYVDDDDSQHEDRRSFSWPVQQSRCLDVDCFVGCAGTNDNNVGWP
jgi:hypothetical protein